MASFSTSAIARSRLWSASEGKWYELPLPPTVGDVLRVDLPPLWTYTSVQWTRNGQGVYGANDTQYMLTALDVGTELAPVFTGLTYLGVQPGGGTGGTTPSVSITTQPVSVTVTEGATATLTVAAQNATGYQWHLAGAPITGATGQTYTTAALALSQSGSVYTVVVTGPGGSVTSSQATVTVTAAVEVPVNTSVPTISGTAQEGQTLTVTAGTWTGSPNSFTRQWMRSGAPIAGATAATYTLVTADVGSIVTVGETASNVGGPAVTPAVSLPTSTVVAAVVVADSRARYGAGAANAYTTPAALLASMTVMGAANASKVAGPFTTAPAAGQYGWVAVEAVVSAAGVTFTDSLGTGGWSGAGLPGNNTGASPSVSTSTVTVVVGDVTWRLFRADYAAATFTGSIS